MSEAAPVVAPSPCAACGGARFQAAFRAAGHGFERCRDCGFERMQDAPGRAELDAYYFEERKMGEQLWQEHAQNLRKFDALLAWIERWTDGRGDFLDVGCSLGTSLVAARTRGWRVLGLELSRPVAEFGRKEWSLDIRERHLADAGLAAASFDLVWMHHTLEHVPDPFAVLVECRRVLRPGGVLFQALPNHDSLKSRLLGAFWSYGITPEHVSHFTARTLSRAVRRAGFEVLARRTPSHAADPRLLLDFMRRIGQGERLMRWCGRADGSFDQDAYIRFLADRRLPYFVCNHLWPAPLVRWLGLGEEVYLVARKGR